MMAKIKYAFVLLVFLFCSCLRNERDSLVVARVIDGIKYTLNYLPDYAAKTQQEYGMNLANLEYYKFSISSEGDDTRLKTLFTPSNYNQLLFYVNSQINNDFKIVNGNDYKFPVQIHFESNNRLSNRIVLLLAFEKFEGTDENTIVFNDNLFNNGIVNFNHKTTI